MRRLRRWCRSELSDHIVWDRNARLRRVGRRVERIETRVAPPVVARQRLEIDEVLHGDPSTICGAEAERSRGESTW